MYKPWTQKELHTCVNVLGNAHAEKATLILFVLPSLTIYGDGSALAENIHCSDVRATAKNTHVTVSLALACPRFT